MIKILFFIFVFFIVLADIGNAITAAAVFEISESNNTINATNNSMDNSITGNAIIETGDKGLISRFLDWLLKLWND